MTSSGYPSVANTAAMTTAASERILDRLRSDGGRITTVRRAVVTALVEADDHHVTAEALATSVQARHPDVHRSTIYRTLDSLADVGVVDHVHLGHGGAVYHLTEDAHQHLVCTDCGTVVQVPGELFHDLAEQVCDAYGFEIDPRHFAMLGRCAHCAGHAAATI